MRTIPIRLLAAFAGFLVFAFGTAWAQPASTGSGQAYPSKPVRVVIVFPPGGATDIVGRVVFQKMGEQMSQQFVIDNRSGAGGTIGAALVAKSPPDGYTLMVYSATHVANPHLYRSLPYDSLRDFTGITPVARLVGMLVVHPSMPVRSVQDLLTLAKGRPGQIVYGTAGNGAYQHMATSLFASMAGINLIHAPYKGGALASIAVAGGEIHMLLTPVSEVLPYVKAGRVRPIAVSSPARITQFPNLPTIGETVKGYELVSWFGVFVPAGAPKPIIDTLNAELKKAVADPGVASNLSVQSLDPMYSTPEEFARLLKSEYDKYARIVKISGAHIE